MKLEMLSPTPRELEFIALWHELIHRSYLQMLAVPKVQIGTNGSYEIAKAQHEMFLKEIDDAQRKRTQSDNEDAPLN